MNLKDSFSLNVIEAKLGEKLLRDSNTGLTFKDYNRLEYYLIFSRGLRPNDSLLIFNAFLHEIQKTERKRRRVGEN